MTQVSGWCIIWSLTVALTYKEFTAMSGDMIGRTLKGRYKLIDERGRGSFATVYVARDIETNRIYAVKVMHVELSNDDEMLARFHREAHILLNLSDPHIVRFDDYAE